MKSLRTHYCVMTYTGEIVYKGRNETKAAEKMLKGTVCGQGLGEDERGGMRRSRLRSLGPL